MEHRRQPYRVKHTINPTLCRWLDESTRLVRQEGKSDHLAVRTLWENLKNSEDHWKLMEQLQLRMFRGWSFNLVWTHDHDLTNWSPRSKPLCQGWVYRLLDMHCSAPWTGESFTLTLRLFATHLIANTHITTIIRDTGFRTAAQSISVISEFALSISPLISWEIDDFDDRPLSKLDGNTLHKGRRILWFILLRSSRCLQSIAHCVV